MIDYIIALIVIISLIIIIKLGITVRCPHCGSPNFYNYTDENNNEIWICDDCGEKFI